MAKYEFTITRTTREEAKFVVEASSREEAIKKALDLANNSFEEGFDTSHEVEFDVEDFANLDEEL